MNHKKKLLLPLSVLAITLIAIFTYIKSNEYIIDPNHRLYKKYEWATWEDSAGGRLARDPNWFILPPEKYIPKEVPFDFSKYRFSSALERRNAYFKHLCETESVGYKIDTYTKELDVTSTSTTNWFFPRISESPIKNIEQYRNNKKEMKSISFSASQNPYIGPDYSLGLLEKGQTMNFNFEKTLGDRNMKNMGRQYQKLEKTTFREYMMGNGKIYRNTFDFDKGEYLPLEEIKLEDIKADYYFIYKEIDRPQMKKLGIHGNETIVVDKKNNILMSYRKSFMVPYYLDSMKFTSHEVPISWQYGGIGCDIKNTKIFAKEIK